MGLNCNLKEYRPTRAKRRNRFHRVNCARYRCLRLWAEGGRYKQPDLPSYNSQWAIKRRRRKLRIRITETLLGLRLSEEFAPPPDKIPTGGSATGFLACFGVSDIRRKVKSLTESPLRLHVASNELGWD